MKKIILFLIILILCGCTKKIECSLNDEYTTNIVIFYNGEKIKKINSMLIFKTDEDAENYCTLLSLSESSLDFICKNNTIKIKDYQKYMGMKINKKEDFLLELINQGFKCE